MGGLRRTSTRRETRSANHSVCSQRGVTRIKERFQESRTLGGICLRGINEGKARLYRLFQLCWNASSFQAMGSGIGHTCKQTCITCFWSLRLFRMKGLYIMYMKPVIVC